MKFLATALFVFLILAGGLVAPLQAGPEGVYELPPRDFIVAKAFVRLAAEHPTEEGRELFARLKEAFPDLDEPRLLSSLENLARAIAAANSEIKVERHDFNRTLMSLCTDLQGGSEMAAKALLDKPNQDGPWRGVKGVILSLARHAVELAGYFPDAKMPSQLKKAFLLPSHNAALRRAKKAGESKTQRLIELNPDELKVMQAIFNWNRHQLDRVGVDDLRKWIETEAAYFGMKPEQAHSALAKFVRIMWRTDSRALADRFQNVAEPVKQLLLSIGRTKGTIGPLKRTRLSDLIVLARGCVLYAREKQSGGISGIVLRSDEQQPLELKSDRHESLMREVFRSYERSGAATGFALRARFFDDFERARGRGVRPIKSEVGDALIGYIRSVSEQNGSLFLDEIGRLNLDRRRENQILADVRLPNLPPTLADLVKPNRSFTQDAILDHLFQFVTEIRDKTVTGVLFDNTYLGPPDTKDPAVASRFTRDLGEAAAAILHQPGWTPEEIAILNREIVEMDRGSTNEVVLAAHLKGRTQEIVPLFIRLFQSIAWRNGGPDFERTVIDFGGVEETHQRLLHAMCAPPDDLEAMQELTSFRNAPKAENVRALLRLHLILFSLVRDSKQKILWDLALKRPQIGATERPLAETTQPLTEREAMLVDRFFSIWMRGQGGESVEEVLVNLIFAVGDTSMSEVQKALSRFLRTSLAAANGGVGALETRIRKVHQSGLQKILSEEDLKDLSAWLTKGVALNENALRRCLEEVRRSRQEVEISWPVNFVDPRKTSIADATISFESVKETPRQRLWLAATGAGAREVLRRKLNVDPNKVWAINIKPLGTPLHSPTDLFQRYVVAYRVGKAEIVRMTVQYRTAYPKTLYRDEVELLRRMGQIDEIAEHYGESAQGTLDSADGAYRLYVSYDEMPEGRTLASWLLDRKNRDWRRRAALQKLIALWERRDEGRYAGVTPETVILVEGRTDFQIKLTSFQAELRRDPPKLISALATLATEWYAGELERFPEDLGKIAGDPYLLPLAFHFQEGNREMLTVMGSYLAGREVEIAGCANPFSAARYPKTLNSSEIEAKKIGALVLAYAQLWGKGFEEAHFLLRDLVRKRGSDAIVSEALVVASEIASVPEWVREEIGAYIQDNVSIGVGFRKIPDRSEKELNGWRSADIKKHLHARAKSLGRAAEVSLAERSTLSSEEWARIYMREGTIHVELAGPSIPGYVAFMLAEYVEFPFEFPHTFEWIQINHPASMADLRVSAESKSIIDLPDLLRLAVALDAQLPGLKKALKGSPAPGFLLDPEIRRLRSEYSHGLNARKTLLARLGFDVSKKRKDLESLLRGVAETGSPGRERDHVLGKWIQRWRGDEPPGRAVNKDEPSVPPDPSSSVVPPTRGSGSDRSPKTKGRDRSGGGGALALSESEAPPEVERFIGQVTQSPQFALAGKRGAAARSASLSPALQDLVHARLDRMRLRGESEILIREAREQLLGAAVWIQAYLTDPKRSLDPKRYDEYARQFFEKVPFGLTPIEQDRVVGQYLSGNGKEARARNFARMFGGAHTILFFTAMQMASHVKEDLSRDGLTWDGLSKSMQSQKWADAFGEVFLDPSTYVGMGGDRITMGIAQAYGMNPGLAANSFRGVVTGYAASVVGYVGFTTVVQMYGDVMEGIPRAHNIVEVIRDGDLRKEVKKRLAESLRSGKYGGSLENAIRNAVLSGDMAFFVGMSTAGQQLGEFIALILAGARTGGTIGTKAEIGPGTLIGMGLGMAGAIASVFVPDTWKQPITDPSQRFLLIDSAKDHKQTVRDAMERYVGQGRVEQVRGTLLNLRFLRGQILSSYLKMYVGHAKICHLASVKDADLLCRNLLSLAAEMDTALLEDEEGLKLWQNRGAAPEEQRLIVLEKGFVAQERRDLRRYMTLPVRSTEGYLRMLKVFGPLAEHGYDRERLGLAVGLEQIEIPLSN